MKIRDLLVILFTAIVALFVLGRAAFADGALPTTRADSACPEETSCDEGPSGGSFLLQLVDWICADLCASTCRVRCAAACANSKDPHCQQACYPICTNDCYFECTRPEPEPEAPDSIDPVIDEARLLRDGGAP